MSIADKAATISANNVTIAENEQKVYDAGYDKGVYDRDLLIWKAITMNGTRHNDSNGYYYAFQRTDFTGYTFVKPIAPTGGVTCQGMFYEYMGKYLPGNLDLSGLSPSTNISQLFTWATSLLEVPDIGLPAMNHYHFTVMRSCKKIEIVRVHEGTTYLIGDFGNLESITFEGVIGKNINLSSAPKLNHDSLMNIINCLKDYSADTSGTTHTLTIGTANVAKLTAEQQQIAIDKGWTIA